MSCRSHDTAMPCRACLSFNHFDRDALGLPHPGIAPTACYQRPVRTAFDNMPFVNHRNLIGTDYRGQAMRNDYDRPSRNQCVNGLLYSELRFGIEGRCRLIQQDNGASLRIAQAIDRSSYLHPAHTQKALIR